MNLLQKTCIYTIVEKGSPGLLSKLPYVLYVLIVNKMMRKNKPKWTENIYLVHLDLLIKRSKLFLNIDTRYGVLTFTYSSPSADGFSLTTNKVDGDTYDFLDPCTKKLYDNTIIYLKKIGEFDSIERDLAKNRARKRELELR